MHIMPGAVKNWKAQQWKELYGSRAGNWPTGSPPYWRGAPWIACVEKIPTLADAWITTCMLPSHQIEGGINEATRQVRFRHALMASGNHIGSIFFPSLEESCEASRGGARRVQSHSQARRLRLEGLQQSSTILDSNIVRFNIPQTLRCCKCSLHFGCFSFGTLAPLNSLLQGEVHVWHGIQMPLS